jgi:O-antigen/teichoic acid export membrane protein
VLRSNSNLVRTPSLKVSFIWTLAGSVTYAASQWALIILFAKLGTASLVGQYAFAIAVAYPMSLLANLQLRVVFVNDLAGRFPFNRMLGVRYALALSAWVVLLLICVLSRSTAKTTVLVLIVGTALLMDTLSESYYSILQKYERMDRIARSQIGKSLLSFTSCAVILYFTHNLTYAVCGMLLGRVLVLIAYDSAAETFRIGKINSQGREELPNFYRLSERFRPRWNFKSQFQMVWLALPLGIVSALVSFNGNIPRYVIEHFLGPRDLGIYSALNYIPQAATMIAMALGNVTFARLSKFHFTGDIRGFRGLLRKNVLLCAGLGALALLVAATAGPTIIRILYRPEYAEHSDLLMWLVATGAVVCLASAVGCAMSAASQFFPQIPLFVVVGAVSAGGAFALVPRFGLQGAAMASLAAITVQFWGAYYIVARALKTRSADIPHETPSVVNA